MRKLLATAHYPGRQCERNQSRPRVYCDVATFSRYSASADLRIISLRGGVSIYIEDLVIRVSVVVAD